MQGSMVGNHVYCLDPFAYEELDVGTTAVGFNTAYANECQYVEWRLTGGEVMYRIDGQNPTSSVGVPVYDGDKDDFTRKEALKAKFIRIGSTNGKIRATFYR